MYATGEGIMQDDLKAVEFFYFACMKGHSEGCYNLGVMYGNGEGVKQDDLKAASFFNMACKGGFDAGCKNYEKLNK